MPDVNAYSQYREAVEEEFNLPSTLDEVRESLGMPPVAEAEAGEGASPDGTTIAAPTPDTPSTGDGGGRTGVSDEEAGRVISELNDPRRTIVDDIKDSAGANSDQIFPSGNKLRHDLIQAGVPEALLKSNLGDIGLADLIPGVEAGLSFNDLLEAQERRHRGEDSSMVEEGGLAIATVLGTIPFLGAPASKVVKATAKAAGKGLKAVRDVLGFKSNADKLRDAMDTAIKNENGNIIGSQAHIATLNDDNLEVVGRYQGDSSDINSALRNGDPTFDKFAKSLDTIIAERAMNQNVVVYRGIDQSVVGKTLPKPGDTIIDPAFVSTSYSVRISDQFTQHVGDKRVILKIKVPEGQNALDLSATRNVRDISGVRIEDEFEVLLPRNTPIKIEDVHEFENQILIKGAVGDAAGKPDSDFRIFGHQTLSGGKDRGPLVQEARGEEATKRTFLGDAHQLFKDHIVTPAAMTAKMDKGDKVQVYGVALGEDSLDEGILAAEKAGGTTHVEFMLGDREFVLPIDHVIKNFDSIKGLEASQKEFGQLQGFLGWAGRDAGKYLPDKTLNISLLRMNTTDDIKAAAASLGDITRAGGKKFTESMDETISRLSEVTGTDIAVLKKRAEQANRLAVEINDTTNLMTAAAYQLRSMARIYDPMTATASDKLKIMLEVQALSEVFKYGEMILSAPGRALNIQKVGGAIDFDSVARVNEMIGSFGGEKAIDDLMRALGTAENPVEIAKTVRPSVLSRAGDAVMEFWVNGILSGVKTLAVNTVGNTLFMGWQVPERAIQGMVGAIRAGGRKDVDRVFVGESIAMMYGTVKGLKDGLRLAGKAFRTGDPQFDSVAKIEMPELKRAISSDQLGLTGIPGIAADVLGAVIRTPTRVIMTQDELFKGIASSMQNNALAYRTVVQSGGSLTNPKQVIDKMKSVLDDVDAYPAIQKDSQAFAQYVTFQKELGNIGQDIQKNVGRFRLLGIPVLRFVLPFIRTPTNIFKAGVVERNPAVAIISPSFYKELEAGGARADAAMGKLAMGSAVGAVAASMAMEGQITGSGPIDQKQRQFMRSEFGWRPYSIRVQKGLNADGSPKYEYVSYSRLEPLAFLIGAVADTVDILKYQDQVDVDQSEIDEAQDLAVAIVSAIAQNTMSKTFMTGFTDFIHVMDDPKRYMDRWVQRYSSSFVPNIIRDVKTSMDDDTIRQVETSLEAIKSKVPGMGKDLPPVTNYWGDIRTRDKGWVMGASSYFSPMATSEESHSPADKEIKRLAIDGIKGPDGERLIFDDAMPTKPKRDLTVDGVNIRLTPWEHYDLITMSSRDLQIDYWNIGKKMNQKEALDHMVTRQDAYINGSAVEQAGMINFVMREYKQAARDILIEREEIQNRLIERMIFLERANQAGEQ